jgi:hypothetical protein
VTEVEVGDVGNVGDVVLTWLGFDCSADGGPNSARSPGLSISLLYVILCTRGANALYRGYAPHAGTLATIAAVH